MSLQFPTNPTLNQQFTASNSVTYQWDGSKWVSISAVLPSGTNSISNNGNVVQVTADGTLQLPNYNLPSYSGSSGAVLGYSGSTVTWIVEPTGYTGENELITLSKISNPYFSLTILLRKVHER